MRGILRAAWLTALLAWAGGGERVGADAPRSVADEPYPDVFRARVQAEIERGTKALLARLTKTVGEPFLSRPDHGPGERALVLLTLLKCGVSPQEPVIEKGFATLRTRPPRFIYDTAVLLMAIAARYDGGTDPFAREALDAEGRHVVAPPVNPEPADQTCLEKGVAFLLKAQAPWADPLGAARTPAPGRTAKGKGAAAAPGVSESPEPPRAWGYPGGMESSLPDWVDVSNTQYALLGLKAAAHCGVPIPPKAWLATLSALLAWQDDVGAAVTLRGNELRGPQRLEWTEAAQARGYEYSGHPYRHRNLTGGDTAAGACGLLICQSELWGATEFGTERRRRTREAVRDALAWMQANFDVAKNPGETPLELPKGIKLPPGALLLDPWFGSYLYSLERMGIMAHVRFLGTHDWYQEGAESILARRTQPQTYESGTDDCFDLLFLRRASFRTSRGAITPGDGPLPPPK